MPKTIQQIREVRSGASMASGQPGSSLRPASVMPSDRAVRPKRPASLWDDRWHASSGVLPAVKFRGKVYTIAKDTPSGVSSGRTHNDVIEVIIAKLGVTAKELDAELTDKSFGYTVNGKWTKAKEEYDLPDLGKNKGNKPVYFQDRLQSFKGLK